MGRRAKKRMDIFVGAQYQRRLPGQSMKGTPTLSTVISIDRVQETVTYVTIAGQGQREFTTPIEKFQKFYRLHEGQEDLEVPEAAPKSVFQQIADAIDQWKAVKAKLLAAEAEVARLKQDVEEHQARVIQSALKAVEQPAPKGSMWTTPVDPNAPPIQEAQIDRTLKDEDV